MRKESVYKELLEGLRDDHLFICKKMAGGDLDTPTNSGDAFEAIVALEDELTLVERQNQVSAEECQDEVREAENERDKAYEERDCAEARTLELEEAVVMALTYLRCKNYEEAFHTLDAVKSEPVFSSAEECRKRYAAAMERAKAQQTLSM